MDEAVARRGNIEAARLVDMAIEEEGGQAEGGGKTVVICSPSRFGRKEIWQRQHAVGITLSRLPADRPARFRRDVDEFGAGAGCHAFREIEPEAEVVEHRKFEAHEQFAGIGGIGEMIDTTVSAS